MTQAQKAFLIGLFLGGFFATAAYLAIVRPVAPVTYFEGHRHRHKHHHLTEPEDGFMFGPQRWDQGALAPQPGARVCPNGIYDAPGGNLRQC